MYERWNYRSTRRSLTSDDSDSDFQLVKKKSQRKSRKSKDNVDCSLTNNALVCSSNPIIVHDNIVGQSNVNPNANPIRITNESKRYALSRFPFSAFIIRFNSGSISAAQVKSLSVEHCHSTRQIIINILHYRMSKRFQGISFYDCFIFVQDASSFSFLLNELNWPNRFLNECFLFPSKPSIPPQLCLLIKNVKLDIDLTQFCLEIQGKYPSVTSVIRDDLLVAKRILINSTPYHIVEYLAPAYVLICSKCLVQCDSCIN